MSLDVNKLIRNEILSCQQVFYYIISHYDEILTVIIFLQISMKI